jgi:hypothetical protein
MSEYYPDGWTIVKVEGSDPHYRVFGSWSGGYLDGDSWRLNSGITRCIKEQGNYIFEGTSGSIYICHEAGYGRLNAFSHGVLQDIVDDENTHVADKQEWETIDYAL